MVQIISRTQLSQLFNRVSAIGSVSYHVRCCSLTYHVKGVCYNDTRPRRQYSCLTPPSVKLRHVHSTYFTRTISFWGSSKVTEWNKVVSDAEKIVGYSTSFMSLRCLLSDELSNVAMHMRKMVGTNHPLLKTARKLFYDGKHSMQTRGLLVLLMSKAGGATPDSVAFSEVMVSGIYPSQRTLAEITEMIHTASLIHKGVINLGGLVDSSQHDMEFGNKMAVLSGDFLLANASTGLAELHNTQVVEIISSAIGNMMKAEFTRLRDHHGNCVLPLDGATIDDWERQTYLTSGSLIAKSCKAALALARHPTVLQERAFEFGKQMAFAHQMKEDLQPIINPTSDDTSNGITTTSGPILLHVNSHLNDPEIRQLCATTGIPSQKLLRLVAKNSGAVRESKRLCHEYGQNALKALGEFNNSDARQALQNIIKAITAF